MCADQNVDLACLQVVQRHRDVAGRFCAAQVLDTHRELAQTVREGAVVLQREDRRRHQNRHLLTVGHSLKCRTHSHFGLAKTYVATHQTIHRAGRLHILLDRLDRLLLVGRILILERGLQLVLQVSVGRKSKTGSRLALGVECDQLARDIFDRLFGGVLQLLPSTRTEFIDLWRLAVARFVARDAV